MSWHKPAVAALLNPRASTIFKTIVWRWLVAVTSLETIASVSSVWISLPDGPRNNALHLLDDSVLLKRP